MVASGTRLHKKHLEGTCIRELFKQFDDSNGTRGADPAQQSPGYIRDNIYNKEGERFSVFRQFPEKNFIAWARRCSAEWITNRAASGQRRAAAADGGGNSKSLFVLAGCPGSTLSHGFSS